MASKPEQQLADVAFTHDWYEGFLDRLQSAGYEFTSFSGSLEEGEIVLRHDVDLSVDAAHRMAHIEADRGIRSTYCLLLTSPLYNPLREETRTLLREIEELGHDLALHFSTHEYWSADDRPETATLERQVMLERSMLETVVRASDVVSFHRPPEWVLDAEFGSFRNTYAPEYFGDVAYFADSGQRWRERPPPVEELPDRMQVLVHPGLWATSDEAFERRIEEAIAGACRRASRNSRREFIEGEPER